MYRSLYSVLKSVISSKSTGVLEIVHYSDDRGMIYLSQGAIVRVKTSELSGTKAAEQIFSWLSFFAQFKEKPIKITGTPKSVEQTKKIMLYLANVDKKIRKIINDVEGCEAVIALTQTGRDAKDEFTPEDQGVALALDGVKTIIEILVHSELYELEVLLIISGFVDRKFAEIKSPHASVTSDESNRFFEIVVDMLSDITGPVGEIIVDEVCDAMGMARENLCKSDIGPLLNAARKRLDTDEQDALDVRDIVAQAFPEG